MTSNTEYAIHDYMSIYGRVNIILNQAICFWTGSS